MKFALAIATLAAVVAATPQRPNLYLEGPGKAPAPVPAPAPAPAPESKNDCVKCAEYCSDDSNGNALGAACYVVKCGIKCIIG